MCPCASCPSPPITVTSLPVTFLSSHYSDIPACHFPLLPLQRHPCLSLSLSSRYSDIQAHEAEDKGSPGQEVGQEVPLNLKITRKEFAGRFAVMAADFNADLVRRMRALCGHILMLTCIDTVMFLTPSLFSTVISQHCHFLVLT